MQIMQIMQKKGRICLKCKQPEYKYIDCPQSKKPVNVTLPEPTVHWHIFFCGLFVLCLFYLVAFFFICVMCSLLVLEFF